MAPVGNVPFLEYLMDYWRGEGISRFILSVGYKSDVIENHFGASFRGAEVVYSREETLLGTGGGLLLSSRKLKSPEPFAMINGDTFFGVSLQSLTDFFDTKKADLCLALREVEKNTRYGAVELDGEGRVTSLKGEAKGGRALINGGVYLMNPRIPKEMLVPEIPVSFEIEIIPRLMKKGERCFGLAFAEPFIDIGIPEDYLRAGEVFKSP